MGMRTREAISKNLLESEHLNDLAFDHRETIQHSTI